jgi:hypothetical protein
MDDSAIGVEVSVVVPTVVGDALSRRFELGLGHRVDAR